MKKRILAVVLAIVMVVSSYPMFATAIQADAGAYVRLNAAPAEGNEVVFSNNLVLLTDGLDFSKNVYVVQKEQKEDDASTWLWCNDNLPELAAKDESELTNEDKLALNNYVDRFFTFTIKKEYVKKVTDEVTHQVTEEIVTEEEPTTFAELSKYFKATWEQTADENVWKVSFEERYANLVDYVYSVNAGESIDSAADAEADLKAKLTEVTGEIEEQAADVILDADYASKYSQALHKYTIDGTTNHAFALATLEVQHTFTPEDEFGQSRYESGVDENGNRVHTIECVYCGETHTEACTLKGDYDGHEHWTYCEICDYESEHEEHDYTLESGELNLKYQGKDDNQNDYHALVCTVCGYVKATSAETCVYVNDNGDVSIDWDSDGHWNTCLECGHKTEPEKHTFNNGWYHQYDGEFAHAPECDVCGYYIESAKEECSMRVWYNANGHWEACEFCGRETELEPHTYNQGYYVCTGKDVNGNYYHCRQCDDCDYIDRSSEEKCTMHKTGNNDWGTYGDYETHHVWCEKCDLSFDQRCIQADMPKPSTKEDGTHCHRYYCEECGQIMRKQVYLKDEDGWYWADYEPHDYKWKSMNDHTLFRGSTMVHKCWCGQIDTISNADIMWALGNRKDVSIDDVGMLVRLGYWLGGTGTFLGRILIEPIRLFVNLFYHLYAFDDPID